MTTTTTPETRHESSTNHTSAGPEAARGNGRDRRGRFTRGNGGGPGNPFAAAVARLRKAALAVVTPEDMQSVFRVLLLRAQGGHLPAMKLLFAYTIGLPTATVDPDEVEEPQPEAHASVSTLSPEAQAMLQALLAAAGQAAKKADRAASVKPAAETTCNGQKKGATPPPATTSTGPAGQGPARPAEVKPGSEVPVRAAQADAPSTNGGIGAGAAPKADGERPGPRGRTEAPSTNGGNGEGTTPGPRIAEPVQQGRTGIAARSVEAPVPAVPPGTAVAESPGGRRRVCLGAAELD
jgi:hypothetical protein